MPLDLSQYNQVLLDQGGISVLFIPQEGSGLQNILALPMPPALAEEVMGGMGTSVLRLWVDFQALAPRPQSGDQMIVGGLKYVIANVEAELANTGGALLKLRVQ